MEKRQIGLVRSLYSRAHVYQLKLTDKNRLDTTRETEKEGMLRTRLRTWDCLLGSSNAIFVT